MGFFDFFKRKSEEPKENLPNSLHTLKFIIPYFSIFDKTDVQLSAFPIKIAVTGSCQFRIKDSDRYVGNKQLKFMTIEELEEHVKDAISMTVKMYFNSIKTIPLLQFESMVDTIGDATKEYLYQELSEELGLDLRTFHISEVRYDVEDPNYLLLQTMSQKAVEARTKKADTETEMELEQIRLDSALKTKRKQAELELDLKETQRAKDLAHKKAESMHNLDVESKEKMIAWEQRQREREFELSIEKKKQDLDIERKKKEQGLKHRGTVHSSNSEFSDRDIDSL